MLFACSSGDTIVSLNVNSSGDVLLTRLHVKIAQRDASYEEDLMQLPTKDVQIEGAAGGVTKPVIVSSFYRRIKLPSAFKDGEASLDVAAYEGDSLYAQVEQVSIDLEEKQAVAAFVDLKRSAPAVGGAGGTSATGAGGTSQPGAGGTGVTTSRPAQAGASSSHAGAAGIAGTAEI